MKCTCCGSDMQKGYIQSRDGVYWSNKLQVIAAIKGLSSDSIKLSGDNEGPFSGSYVVAWKCNKCRKILIEY